MLVFAMVVTLAAFAQVGLARDGSAAGRACTATASGSRCSRPVAYVVVARFAPYADPLLLPLAVIPQRRSAWR